MKKISPFFDRPYFKQMKYFEDMIELHPYSIEGEIIHELIWVYDKRIEKLEKALEFYASTSNWDQCRDWECASFDMDDKCIIEDDLEILGEFDVTTGGKKARQVLKELYGE